MTAICRRWPRAASGQYDATLVKSLMAGVHCLHGFSNRDIRTQVTSARLLHSCADDPKKVSGKVGRCFRRLHAHGLIAIPPVGRGDRFAIERDLAAAAHQWSRPTQRSRATQGALRCCAGAASDVPAGRDFLILSSSDPTGLVPADG